MGNRTTRKSKLVKERVESKTELAMHAKKLSDKTLKNYFKRAVPIFIVQLIALLLMLLVSKEAGASVGIAFICMDGLITLTYFIVIDALPARKMKKNSRDLQKELSVNQIKVFYAALRTQTIIRTPINALMTLIIFIVTLVVFVI